jgi:hypothetical protein
VIRRLAFALSLFSVCCSSRADIEARQSAGHVAHAIEQLRNASNPRKPTALAELKKLGCSGAEVCEARDACQSAYTEHIDALNLIAAAKLKLAEGQPQESANLLGAAQEKLAQASSQVSRCTEREAALRRRYKL